MSKSPKIALTRFGDYSDFGHYRSNHMGVSKGTNKFWGRSKYAATSCYIAKFGHSMSNGTNMIREIYWKNLTPRVPVPPYKVTGTDTD